MVRRLTLGPLERLLCRALAADPVQKNLAISSLRRTLGDEGLFSLAKENDVASLIAHELLQKDGNKAAPCWKDIHAVIQCRISAYLSEMDRIARRLAEEGIPMVALKNGGIARGIYHCPGCCPMGDLDVLVQRRHFLPAHKFILADGYRFEFRSPLEKAELTAAEKKGGTEYWKSLKGGEKVWLELQWRAVAGRWIRQDQEPSSEDLLARSIPIPNSAVRLLAPEDNLLQVALHTAKHSYVRAPGFRLHLDVDRIVHAYPNLDWKIFLCRVRELQVKTAVYFSLAIPAHLLGTPIPKWVMQETRPPRWKETLISRWLSRVGLFNPVEQKFSKPGYVLFTSLLYDDFKGFWRGLFPNHHLMTDGSLKEGKVNLLSAYVRRILNLLLERVDT